MNRLTIGLAFTSIVLTALAQVTLKKAMLNAPVAWSGVREVAASVIVLLLNPFLIAGMALYAVSIVLWLAVLSRAEVSAAYPMAAIGFIITAVIAHVTLGEALPVTRMLGIGLICAGVILISRSA